MPGEAFSLTNHAARDILRYNFIKDINGLERGVLARPGVVGYAILLTNDSGYWTAPSRANTVDAAFHLHEGITLSGEPTWAAHTGQCTMEGRESPLELRGSYALS